MSSFYAIKLDIMDRQQKLWEKSILNRLEWSENSVYTCENATMDVGQGLEEIAMENSSQLTKAGFATRLFFFISGFALATWAPMVPYAKERLNLNDADLGLVLFQFGIGALLFMPVTGWLVHRYGSGNICLSASGFMILLLPGLAIAPSAALLGGLLFLFGMVCGSANISVNSQGVAVQTHAKRSLMSGFHCLFSVGGLVGASLMSVLLEAGLELLTCASLVSFIIGILVLSQSRSLLPAQFDIKPAASNGFSWPSSKVFILGVFCFILFLAEGAMLDWSAVFLTVSGNYDEAIAGIGFALFSIAMAIGRWTGDNLTHRFGTIPIIQWGSLIAAAGLFMTLAVDWNHLELIGFLLIGFGASNIVPLLFSAAGCISDAPSSFSLTVVTTFGYTGILLGPALIGFMAELTSLSLALACVAALLIFVGLSVRTILAKEGFLPSKSA